MKRSVVTNIILAVLFLVSFIVVLSDQAPESNMSLGVFFVLKFIALAVISFCLNVWGVIDYKSFFEEEQGR